MSIRNTNTSHKKQQGIAIIDTLVVVLVLAILMAVALPFYLGSEADSHRSICRANMKAIANAVEASAVRLDVSDYTDQIAGGITRGNLPGLVAIPICPDGGTYTLLQGNSGDNSTFKVSCSFAKHGAFQPGIDGN